MGFHVPEWPIVIWYPSYCTYMFSSCFFHETSFHEQCHEPAIWRFPSRRVPQNGWFVREHPTKMDDLGGYPHLWKLPHGSGLSIPNPWLPWLPWLPFPSFPSNARIDISAIQVHCGNEIGFSNDLHSNCSMIFVSLSKERVAELLDQGFMGKTYFCMIWCETTL